jgi:glycosyltransferase involved in cell wall biosynthesis
MVGEAGALVKTKSNDMADGDIHVLNVCETAKGGIATYLNLLWKINGNGVDHRFIVLDSHRSQLGPDMPVTTFSAGKSRLFNTARIFRAVMQSRRKSRVDIIFFHSTFTLPVMVALRLLRVRDKFVYCPHGWAANRYEEGSTKNRIVKFCEKWMSGFSDVVVNISRHDEKYALQESYRGKHVVIENAVQDLPESRDSPADLVQDQAIRLLFVGRFDRQKGLDVLLDAFAKARAKRKSLLLDVVGAGVLRDETLKTHAPKGVVFHGWVGAGEIAEYYARSDLLIVPSRWEGFGLVVAEAMRAGTPVFVSDRGNLPDLVAVQKTGYVAELTCDEFYNILVKLDKTVLRAMRPSCLIEFQARFHQDRFSLELTDLFKDMLKS